MSQVRPILFAIVGIVFLADVAAAGPVLSIAPDLGVDPNNLIVGQTARFDVVLSGLGVGDQLAYLAGTVTFPAGLLGTASEVNAGAIVPDATGFVSAGFSGAADAFYDAVFFSLTNTPITSNGVFYTFDVTPVAPGTGDFSFDLSSLAAADGANNSIPLDATAPLPFQIHDSAAAPEPASLTMLLIGMVTATTMRGRRCVRVICSIGRRN